MKNKIFITFFLLMSLTTCPVLKNLQNLLRRKSGFARIIGHNEGLLKQLMRNEKIANVGLYTYSAFLTFVGCYSSSKLKLN